jgi:hypothetical protein
MSTQTLQPLIWLARRWTRSSVRCDTSVCSVDFARACRARFFHTHPIFGIQQNLCRNLQGLL